MHALMQEGAVSLIPGVLCERKHWQSHTQQAGMLMIGLHAAMHDHTTSFCLSATLLMTIVNADDSRLTVKAGMQV